MSVAPSCSRSTVAPSRLRRGGRRSVLSVVSLVLCGALAACASGSSDSGSRSGEIVPRDTEPGRAMSEEKIAHLNVGLMGKIPQLDPTENVEEGLTFDSNMLEPLLRVDAEGQIQPWLATGFEAVSDTVYEYTLRDGVKFWDGTELTSADVKYTWDRMISEDDRPGFASVKSIEAPDAHTIRVTLTKPDASWQYTPTQFYSVIYQKKFAEKAGDKFGQPSTLVMGTGPWRVDTMNPTTGLELSAFDDYWGGKAPIDKVSVKFFADNNSMALALRADEIDIAPNVSDPEGFDAAAGGGAVTTVPICSTSVLALPTRTAPWDDVHVRRAVAHAINREDVVTATRGRGVAPGYTLISPTLLQTLAPDADMKDVLADVETYPYDLAKAKAELAKSKVPDGFSAEFPTLASYASVSQVIAGQLKKIGIDLKVATLPDTAWYAAIGEDNPPLTFTENTVCSPDPSGDPALFLTTDPAGEPIGANIPRYAPADLPELLTSGLATQDPAQRLEIYVRLLERLGEDVPYVPMYTEGNTYASTEYDIAEYDGQWVNFPWLLNVIPR